eukprot:15433174-Alexandrium_andersonii.AAC.1
MRRPARCSGATSAQAANSFAQCKATLSRTGPTLSTGCWSGAPEPPTTGCSGTTSSTSLSFATAN